MARCYRNCHRKARVVLHVEGVEGAPFVVGAGLVTAHEVNACERHVVKLIDAFAGKRRTVRGVGEGEM